ncbi:uncharacterized protein FRV6_07518 [Fusarium oxysporum]|uniref:Uncharacterized protein n=1 Tax=Fusarium oxysporum TaxID=5507 RepID=A0A2H3TCD0_FUSOX|nr:uncharacterized protein FRV6_07518 [Fusarium oxysporum]
MPIAIEAQTFKYSSNPDTFVAQNEVSR